MANSKIFSEKALERLKRPNIGGQTFSVTSPVAWIALAAVAISIFSVILWSIFGIMADKVMGYGIILNKDGVANIAPTGSGRIIKMGFMEGQKVSKGDVVAMIEQTSLEQDMFLEVEEAQDAGSHADFHSLASQLAAKKEQYRHESEVVSPFSGTIICKRQRAGDVISAGTPLYDVRVEEGNQEFIAMLYVPALTGNKIKRGTPIQVSPGAIDSSLYGSLVGNVVAISDYPVTSTRISFWTGNEEFAKWIVQQCNGSVMEVRVELIHDDNTPSGYLWTTLNGSDEKITSGMTCTATAIVKREAPLVKAFNKLNQWLRSD